MICDKLKKIYGITRLWKDSNHIKVLQRISTTVLTFTPGYLPKLT